MIAPKYQTNLLNGSTILQRVAAGDKLAVEECVRVYSGLVWKLARNFTGTTQDAEDAVQEIFISIWESAARFDAAKSPELAFIRLIAQRKLIDRLRKSKNRRSEISMTEMEIAETRENVYQKIHLNLELKPIIEAMNNLSPAQIELIKMSIYAGSSHTEIAKKTGLPLGTVKSSIKRGLDKIRRTVGVSVSPDICKAYYA